MSNWHCFRQIFSANKSNTVPPKKERLQNVEQNIEESTMIERETRMKINI